jgi:hypothetical protein
LRVRATFADPVVWYEANAAFGRDLQRLGAMMLVAALLVPRVAGRHAALVLSVGAVLGVAALAAVGTARANRLLAAHQGARRAAPSASDVRGD